MQTGWKHKIKIKDLLEDTDDDNAHAAKVGPVAAERVRALAEKFEDDYHRDDLEGIAEQFEEAAEVLDDGMSCEVFNDALRNLYDFGDVNRVWVG